MQWGQEEHGRIYYTPSEKAKQKGRPHQAFFLHQCLPTPDNLRNFLLTPTREMLSFLQLYEKRL